MSMRVGMIGNPVRHGRMVLSDLDQIKKNELDRRRRLRLVQVQQQSKEISIRLLERYKKLKSEEFGKLEKDGKSELRQMHDRRILDVQRKYQEDLEDIGQAHASAALQPDADAIMEEEARKDRAVALKRGKDAVEHMKDAKQTDDARAFRQEKLCKVREVENIRAAMIARLPKPSLSEENDRIERHPPRDENEEIMHQILTPKRKSKKVLSNKSPRRVKKSDLKEHRIISPKPSPSGLRKKSAVQSHELSSRKRADKYVSDQIEHIDDASDDQVPRRIVPTMSTILTKPDKIAKYNPEDYTQDTSNSISNSVSTSDDSLHFSDAKEQITSNKTPRIPVLTKNKVQSQSDRSTHQSHVYDRLLGIVERIDIRNEPSAMEAAQALKNAEDIKTHIFESRKLNAQRRGEDAILRERVRRDYQMLLQNLDHLAQEERKLKASQIPPAEEDTCMGLHQRNKCHEEHQKKLNRAAKKIFGTDSASTRRAHLTEKVITLPVQKNNMHDGVPNSTWQDPHLIEEQVDDYHTQQDKDSEMSRNEQLMEMIKKVERQRRLLYEEFGTGLPDNIFNVSMKPLFEDKMLVKANTAKPLSPEIKVINMSSSDECITKVPDKSSAEKIEIAVQTILEQTGSAENKSVQVELPQKDMPNRPKYTIIKLETDDSSNNSTSSEISGMIIEIDEKEIIVTPKKRKHSVRVSKRLSPRIYQRIHSTSISSKATSPMRRFSRFQPSTRLTRQKKTKHLDAPARNIEIHANKSIQVDDELGTAQETKLSIDASAESSQTFSNDQSLDKSERSIRIKDSSDTSTSFINVPPITPKSMLDTQTHVTPILEMLDSAGPDSEELKRLQQNISPVSTPETPSPRTMMMPSNIPYNEKIRRMLRFSSNDSQTNDSILSSTQKDQSTLTDPLDLQKPEASKHISINSQQTSSSKVCTCKNLHCKLLHMKLDNTHDCALKNCPEILQKYEDLQNLCTEKIASLTDLIEKLRNDQKDMDFSLINRSDDINLQLSTPNTRYGAQAIRTFIDNIEAIQAQLTKTLRESHFMQKSEAVSKDKTSYDAEIQDITSTSRSKLVDTVKTHVQKSKIVESKAKPKIVSNEKVNIQLNRFKIQPKSQTISTTKTSERNSWPPCTFSLHEEEIIEKLSKEILEQSKNLDKASTAFAALKENDETHKMSSKELHLKKNSLEHENDGIIKEFISTSEIAKENGFIPILSGIPKILRNHGNVASISARSKPPVTLLNGLYRPELESSGHELSTIVEFDTTDTVNKSSKSPAKSKPSVHVAPLPIQQNRNSSKKSADSFDMKHSAEKLSSAQKSQETICNSPAKLKSMADCIMDTKNETEQEYMFEKCNKQLQCNTTTEESNSQAKDKFGSSMSTDLNLHKENKHKTTSTSLYSFSGLSGISEITSSPSSDMLKHNSSPEEMEIALKKLGLGWAVTTLKKTREASALSSSSNSDVTPINTARRMISPTKKHDSNGFPDISDVSSISIKEASKSTEQAVLLKGRTSTPKFQNSNSNSERSSTTNTSESIQDPSESLTVPNVSLTKTKFDNKQLQNP